MKIFSLTALVLWVDLCILKIIFFSFAASKHTAAYQLWSSNCKRNGIFSKYAICSQRSSNKELHVSFSSSSVDNLSVISYAVILAPYY